MADSKRAGCELFIYQKVQARVVKGIQIASETMDFTVRHLKIPARVEQRPLLPKCRAHQVLP